MNDTVFIIVAYEGSEYSSFPRNICVVLEKEEAIIEVEKYKKNLEETVSSLNLIRSNIDVYTYGTIHNQIIAKGRKLDRALSDLNIVYDYEEIELR